MRIIRYSIVALTAIGIGGCAAEYATGSAYPSDYYGPSYYGSGYPYGYDYAYGYYRDGGARHFDHERFEHEHGEHHELDHGVPRGFEHGEAHEHHGDFARAPVAGPSPAARGAAAPAPAPRAAPAAVPAPAGRHRL